MIQRAITAAVLGVGVMAAGVDAQQLNPAAPPGAKAEAPTHKITTEPSRLDLGWMLPQTTMDGTVTLRNTSDEIVNITRVTSSCTCTVGKLTDDQKVLRPGESTELTVTLKSGSNTGPMVQRAYVWYEGARSPFEVYVSADVSRPVKTDPTFVNLLGTSRTGKIRLESLDGTPFLVTSVDGGTPRVFNTDGEPVDASKKQTAFLVEYDYTGVAEQDLDRWFMIETDHPEAAQLPLRVLHRSLYQVTETQPTWSFGADRIILGRMKAGDSIERDVTLKAVEKADEITAIRVEDDGLDVEILNTHPRDRNVIVTLRFVATGATTGLIKSKVVVTAEGQEQSADVIVRVGAPS